MNAAPIPLIMTRPEGANEQFMAMIPADVRAQFQVYLSPLMRIVGMENVPDIGAHEAAVFTSANAVRFAAEGQDRNAYCVGAATTRAALGKGWRSCCLGETSDALVEALMLQSPKEPLRHLTGKHVRGNVVERLMAAGVMISRTVLYDQILMPLDPRARAVLEIEHLVILPIFSPRTAEHFVEICPRHAKPIVLAMSNAVANPLRIFGNVTVKTAPSPTALSMAKCLEKLVTHVRLG